MVSSNAAAAADAPPESPAAIKDGTVAGLLPDSEAFAVHYPAYPSSIDRAVETLGGLPAIAKTRCMEASRLELRFRPEDPYCHPVSGGLRPCAGLLLKISKKTNTSSSDVSTSASPPPPADQLSAEVVARVNHAYHFEGMADYQHVIPVHAAEASRKKRRQRETESGDVAGDCSVEPDSEDVLMLLPDLFSPKNVPQNLVLTPSVNLFSKSIQKGVVEHRWEMDIEPCLAIAFDIERIPSEISWEDNIQKDTEEWELQMAVTKLFIERPIWPRWSLNERLADDGIQVTDHQLKRLLLRTGYYFSTGPFGRFWIKKGYDPRKDPESRIFQQVDFRVARLLRNLVDWNTNAKLKQTWKDICEFRVFPSKASICLQLFELVDDFIQEEIRKPPVQSTCSSVTGWFSRHMFQTLRLRVSIRFLSIFPKRESEALLKSKREGFERSKRMEARSRILKPEYQDSNRDSNNSSEMPSMPYTESIDSEQAGETGPYNDEIEDEEEEEEEELDGYESPPVAGENDTFALDAVPYGAGESIPNNYLQELLRDFPFAKDSKDSQPKDGVQTADLSDTEYQIFEQDSEEDDSS